MKIFRDKKIARLFIQSIFVGVSVGLLCAYFFNTYLGIIAGVLCSLISVYRYLLYRSRDIELLTEYLRRLNDSNYDYELNTYEEGELSILHSELNKITILLKTMNQNLDANNTFLKKSLTDISHQLQTPITSLLLTNDILRNENPDNDFLLQNQEQLDRLESLITALLLLIRLESNTIEMDKKRVNTDDFINNLKLNMSSKSRILHFETRVDANLIYIDNKWFLEAIINILDNKTRYAKDTIFMSIEENVFETQIMISDDGEEIETEIREKVFERFFKKNSANSNSVGVGLAISKEIIEKHGGTVRIVEKNTFEIKIPTK
ncbi:HAMP domain-containing sensor histidine kinase [Erysipelothrix rhusiopathiae]|nr:HAMP domain-containing sensor histidine kinase [Erysipelothrix rhusiopathiae]